MPVFYREAFGELEFELEGFQFDNAGPGEFDTDRRVHSLRKFADTGWEEVSLEGEITLPPDTKELFPPDERGDPPGRILVAIDFPDTHYRDGVTVDTTDIAEGSYGFETTLSRKYAYGTVWLRPILVRTDDCDDRGFAQYPYMRIANGPPIILSFDDVETEGSSLMDVRFESFEKTAGLPDHNLYHLDRHDVDNPRVWINEDYELVTRVLDHDANSGWAANLQSALAPLIAENVLGELVLWALLCATPDGFDADWQESLLDDYGPMIYEKTDADTPVELHEQIEGGGDDAHYVVNVINKVVQDQVRVTPQLEEFIEKEATEYFLEEG